MSVSGSGSRAPRPPVRQVFFLLSPSNDAFFLSLFVRPAVPLLGLSFPPFLRVDGLLADFPVFTLSRGMEVVRRRRCFADAPLKDFPYLPGLLSSAHHAFYCLVRLPFPLFFQSDMFGARCRRRLIPLTSAVWGVLKDFFPFSFARIALEILLCFGETPAGLATGLLPSQMRSLGFLRIVRFPLPHLTKLTPPQRVGGPFFRKPTPPPLCCLSWNVRLLTLLQMRAPGRSLRVPPVPILLG